MPKKSMHSAMIRYATHKRSLTLERFSGKGSFIMRRRAALPQSMELILHIRLSYFILIGNDPVNI